MCLPSPRKQQDQVAQVAAANNPATIVRPVTDPVTVSPTAQALQIGGAPRGAAQLGRLKLRTGQHLATGSGAKRTSIPLSKSLGLGTPAQGSGGSASSVPVAGETGGGGVVGESAGAGEFYSPYLPVSSGYGGGRYLGRDINVNQA